MATLQGFLFHTMAMGGPVALEAFASSPGPDDRFAPKFTIDGDFSTRWSSDHGEPHWIAFDFGELTALHGVRLHWETAYGRDYDIEISDDGENWLPVFSWRDGSGGVDHVYFGPREARFLRLMGIRRGTGWGFSLFQVEFPGPDELRRFSSSPESVALPPDAIMDGDPDTAWTVEVGEQDPDPYLQIDFHASTAFGGLAIHWLEGMGTPWSLMARQEGETEYVELARTQGRDAMEELYIESSEADSIRLVFHPTTDTRLSIGEVTLKGPDETWNPIRHFEGLARTLKEGTFPWWLKREQGFFTVVGRPKGTHATLIDEDGRIEPRKDSFSVTPLLIRDGNLLTARDFEVAQHLVEGWAPIPSVHWHSEELELWVRAVDTSEDTTDVVYTVTNSAETHVDVSLLLALHPLQINPPWQRGGFSPIHEGFWDTYHGIFTANGAEAIRFIPAPIHGGVLGRSDRDVSEYLVEGKGWVHRAFDT
ncbi:MAG: discoidin domain-containing protein, partial [Candidatus Sumerlaeia bacterium]|nr:discoidin domain-containing protein [Candidatus Sumerlaeia bacterium]